MQGSRTSASEEPNKPHPCLSQSHVYQFASHKLLRNSQNKSCFRSRAECCKKSFFCVCVISFRDFLSVFYFCFSFFSVFFMDVFRPLFLFIFSRPPPPPPLPQLSFIPSLYYSHLSNAFFLPSLVYFSSSVLLSVVPRSFFNSLMTARNTSLSVH